MSDVLAIFGPADQDAELLSRIAAYRPDRVTVLVARENGDPLSDETEIGENLRDRIATLMAAIERDTGATVVGLAGDRSQLFGWRFDRELAPTVPLTA